MTKSGLHENIQQSNTRVSSPRLIATQSAKTLDDDLKEFLCSPDTDHVFLTGSNKGSMKKERWADLALGVVLPEIREPGARFGINKRVPTLVFVMTPVSTICRLRATSADMMRFLLIRRTWPKTRPHYFCYLAIASIFGKVSKDRFTCVLDASSSWSVR